MTTPRRDGPIANQSQARTVPGSRWAGVALVNVATLTWASNVTLGRWLRNDLGPLTLAAARFSIASLLFLLLLRQRPVEERTLGKDRWLLLATGLTGVVVFSPLLYTALQHTTVVNVTLINGLAPLITGILALALIGEPMSRRQAAAAGLALVGVVILLSRGSISFWTGLQSNPGDLIAVAAALVWALYSVLGRKVMRHRSALSATGLSAFVGLPLLVLAAGWELVTRPPHLKPELVLAVIYIGIVPTVVGFLAWNAGVRRLGASGAMVFYNTLPLYGALLGTIFLGETLGITYFLGAACIVGAGLWGARA